MTACLWGCGPLVFPEGSTETETEADGTTGTPPPPPPGTTTTTPPPTTTTTPPPPADTWSGEESSSTGFNFLQEPDGSSDGFGCDLWLQDCPLGEKCMPWANDGGNSWNALRCAPIADDPDAVGEPCTVEGSGASGIDSCGAGSMCFYVDPETLEGRCVAFCVGDESNPMCEQPFHSCTLPSDGVIALCLAPCNALAQDCPEGQGCYAGDDGFICVPDASGDVGAPGDACEFINACDPGTVCLPSELVPDCEETDCCTSFCDVTLEPSVCLPGQTCVPWWEDPGEAPPGTETLGVCTLSM